MKKLSVPQFAIVRSDSASTFQEELNEKIRELCDLHPEVTFSETGDTLTARVSYTISMDYDPRAKLPEEAGIKFRCCDCPCFEPILKADGTEDGRAKYGGCKYAEFKRTYKDSNACGVLYTMIQNGGVRLCFSE